MPRWHRGEVGVYLYSFFNLCARRECVVSATPRPLYPLQRDLVSVVQEVGWASEPVWMDPENLSFPLPAGV